MILSEAALTDFIVGEKILKELNATKTTNFTYIEQRDDDNAMVYTVE